MSGNKSVIVLVVVVVLVLEGFAIGIGIGIDSFIFSTPIAIEREY